MKDYFDFGDAVGPRRSDGRHFESRLDKPDGLINAGSRRAVREIPDDNFFAIVNKGYGAFEFEVGTTRHETPERSLTAVRRACGST